jgi:hypothetical protein
VIAIAALLLASCTSFNPVSATVSNLDGEWLIIDGETSLNAFSNKSDEADRALEIIQHYGMNERCDIGQSDSPLKYWLVDGQAPSGELSGELCLSFSPGDLKVKRSDESWKIVDGSNQVFNFVKEEEAREVYRLIQKHSFSRSCSVGRPRPSFLYFRK